MGFGEIMQKLAGKMKLSPEKYSLGGEYKYARKQSSERICKSERFSEFHYTWNKERRLES